MLKHRDSIRKNRANKAVQACLFSKITKESIRRISTGSSENMSPLRIPQLDNTASSLLSLTLSTNEKTVDNFSSSQNSISKACCSTYAGKQHNLILRAFQNKEDVSSILGISPYILNDEILEMYERFNELDINGMYI